MSQDEIVEKLRIDEHYYGKFGNQFLSNSDISVLLSNPLNFKKPSKSSPAFLVGGYFHTCILEPDKLKKYKIIESSSRNTKVYKEMSGGELCLLQHEVDQIEVMRDKMLNNEIISKLITGNVEYEVPGIIEIENNMWKGKADIINHDEKLIIDLKTTNDIQSFRYSAKRYNYDSQAYIYNKLFNYDFLFIVVDKNTHQLGLFDVSDKFYQTGLDKVQKATDVYELFYKTENFKPENYFINQTL
tara:strand:- start:9868 stop:10596 length:729 start_codon:yes stop_codon:yes gene_type:complete